MNLQRLKLMRCAARVQRCHTMPTVYRQSDGEHTFGVLAIILTIWPNASTDILKAALYHDAPEAISGDMPAPAKWRHRDLGSAMDVVEEAIAVEFQLTTVLNSFEERVLKYADIMEFAMFACEEIDMGNRLMCTQFFNAMQAFNRLRLTDITPEGMELYDYVKTRGERLYGNTALDPIDQPLNGWPTY